MAWSLLPVEAMFASVIPGQLMEGRIAGQINFPSWLGKNSRQNKMDRLLQELQLHMRLKISASKRALNLDYLPHVINSIVGPLRRDASQGVDASVKAMESYDLMREDLDSLLEVGQWPNRPEIMAGITHIIFLIIIIIIIIISFAIFIFILHPYIFHGWMQFNHCVLFNRLNSIWVPTILFLLIFFNPKNSMKQTFF